MESTYESLQSSNVQEKNKLGVNWGTRKERQCPVNVSSNMRTSLRKKDPAEVGKHRRNATDGTASVYSESIANAPKEKENERS